MNARPANWIPILERIQRIMRSNIVVPADRRLARVLQGCAALFGLAVRLRSAAYRNGILRSQKLSCRVFSVGNIAVGGTGKTPMAQYVAGELQRMGCRTVLISRGYRGEAEKFGGVVSDGRTLMMDAERAGDEPFMLALLLQSQGVPVIVGRDRVAAGRLALRRFAPDAIVLDDGFQHLRLCRDTDLVLLDAGNPLGNGHLLPRGVLREPPRALRRSHALITTAAGGRHGDDGCRKLTRIARDQPLFRAEARPYIYTIREPEGREAMTGAGRLQEFESLAGRPVFGFSGIAHNERFRATLQNAPCRLQGFLEFPDHYRYSHEDVRRICRAASSVGANWLTTTLKDYVRIQHGLPKDFGIIVLSVTMDFGRQTDRFRRFLKIRLEQSGMDGRRDKAG